ncbi:hypothetical protein O4H49_18710 [Kiloniella laminariae]|uniref:Uncharacterized protein n=1 Tax=Kiloniella laminariae TaxID=454162 RepID=A0ABT4LNX8_9PROT|nr:hypothetical protein [Kiloniella laminariae]MCZ4282823.1 hypothetical protein [Kiloniella laminariae]
MSSLKDRKIGAGRSATVYLDYLPDGRATARKIFVGSTLAGLVHNVIFGANNPYIWHRGSIAEAACRRRVLSKLMKLWLPGKLRIAEIISVSWNEDFRANEITMEFIDGRAPSLHHPFSSEKEGEIKDLVENVMKPLQGLLLDAGFDGLAWQAGYGNPVATSNFLLETTDTGENRWVWVDLESGVPALFPANPILLFTFYLQRTLLNGRPLYDDVDVPRLRDYVSRHQKELGAVLSEAELAELAQDVEELLPDAGDWRFMSRLQRSLQSRLARGKISEEEVSHYETRPVRWYARLAKEGVAKVARKAGELLRDSKLVKQLTHIVPKVRAFVLLPSYRSQLSRLLVARGIEDWHKRRQLDDREADLLKHEIETGETSLYITDFGILMAVKPFVKVITLAILFTLGAFGVIDVLGGIIGYLSSGVIVRTIYTTCRIIASTGRKAHQPWIALVVGFFPVVGNAAYPLQLLYEGTRGGNAVAKFIIYDLMARLGRAVPIWGGPDTLVEHKLNSIGDLLVRKRQALPELHEKQVF